MFGFFNMPMADVGDIINNVGAWVQVHIGVTTIRTLGVAATIYGFFMVSGLLLLGKDKVAHVGCKPLLHLLLDSV